MRSVSHVLYIYILARKQTRLLRRCPREGSEEQEKGLEILKEAEPFENHLLSSEHPQRCLATGLEVVSPNRLEGNVQTYFSTEMQMFYKRFRTGASQSVGGCKSLKQKRKPLTLQLLLKTTSPFFPSSSECFACITTFYNFLNDLISLYYYAFPYS